VIDPAPLPRCSVTPNIGHCKRDDLVGQHFGSSSTKRVLNLRQDHAEVSDRNNMAACVFSIYGVDNGSDPSGCVVPAFATGGGAVARRLPLGAPEFRMRLGHLGQVFPAPVPPSKPS